MKIRYYIIVPLMLLAAASSAQEFDAQIDKAKSAYEAGNYDDSRMAVMNALHEIDMQIGREVLALLPETLNAMSYEPESDQITGSSEALVGMYVERTWGDPGAENIYFSVISDSPLLAAVNTFLAMPAILYSSDSNQKKIKVAGYKALLERKVDEESGAQTGFSLQLPYSNALMQINYTGEISESDFLALVEDIPVSDIAKLAQ